MDITAPPLTISTASLYLNISLVGKDIEFRVNVNGKIKKLDFQIIDQLEGILFISIPSLIAGAYPYKIFDLITNTVVSSGTLTISSVAGVPTEIDAIQIADGTVTNTEFQYLNGVTSNIQTQINATAPLASPTFTGTITTPSLIVEDLTDGYVPYQVIATDKLGDSPIYTDGTKAGIGTSTLTGKFNVQTAAGDNIIYANDYSTTTGHTNYWFSRKSASNIGGTLAQTANLDYLGAFYFQGVNTTPVFAYGAAIYAKQNGVAGTFIPTDLNFSTHSATAQNVNQLVLSSTGGVSAGFGLHVGGASDAGDNNLLVDGAATVSGLAGTGVRVVTASAAGLLSTDALPVTPIDDVLDWSTNKYTPYADNAAAAAAGKFYLGTILVAAANLRLNYTGGIYSNSDSGYGIVGTSESSTGVLGFSTTGVAGIFNNGLGNTSDIFRCTVNNGARFSVNKDGGVIVGAPIRLKVYTVVNLPAGTQGDYSAVSDALAPTFLTAVVGGGAVYTPVTYNGTAWVCV